MEQRKFVVPEVVVGKNVMELIGRYLGHFGSRKTMIVTDKNILKLNWFQNIINNLMKKDIEYIIFDEVSENPRDYEAMLGAELFLAEDCDSIVAVGGGSPMDCAKCISIVCTNGGHILDYVGVDQIRLPGPPLICIPSTAGTAAEVSQFAIILDSKIHIKKAIISKKVVPDLALIDTIPLLTMDTYLTACTGMDALTHAIEAYVSNAASPLTDVHALKAIELISKALPNAMSSNKEEFMEDMLMGSLHAGFAFSNASLGAVHALAHSLGGVLDLPHGQCNSMLLEHVIDLNFKYAQDRYKDIAIAVGCEVEGLSSEEIKACLIDVISELREKLSIPEKLSEKINPELAEELYVNAINDPCMVTNPKNLSYKEVKGIYEKIFKE